MAFMNEIISEADKKKYDEFNFISPLTGKPVPARKWTIDRERDVFLVPLGGQGGEFSEIPEFFVLIWKNNIIRIEAFHKGCGNYQVGVELWWRITKIVIPEGSRHDSEKVIGLIKESIDALGSYYKRDHVIKVNFDEIATPVFVPEVQ